MNMDRALAFYTLENAILYPEEKVAVFIDGSNFYSTIRAIGVNVDYRKLYSYLRDKCHVVRMSYYTALLTEEDSDKIKIKPMLDFIEYNGFLLVTKPAKEILRPNRPSIIKGDMDVEIVVDAMILAKSVDHIMLFSGDSDFVPLLKALDQMGKRTTVVSSFQHHLASDEIRKAATHFVELTNFIEEVKQDFEETKE